MANVDVDRICSVVTEALKAATNRDDLPVPITEESGMNNPSEWDSLSYVVVYNSIGTEFDIELEDDDAIHFQDIRSIKRFLDEALD